jgi:hypothetical protein
MSSNIRLEDRKSSPLRPNRPVSSSVLMAAKRRADSSTERILRHKRTYGHWGESPSHPPMILELSSSHDVKRQCTLVSSEYLLLSPRNSLSEIFLDFLGAVEDSYVKTLK